MDFSLTKQQRDIKKAAAEFAAREFLPDVAQEHELNHRYPRELFKKAAQLGFIGLDYPERIGGGGMGVTGGREFWSFMVQMRLGVDR